MKKLRMRRNYKISKILIGVLFLIFFLTFLLVKFYSQKVSPKVIEVAEVRIKRFTESFLSNNIGYDILNDEVIDDILVINKNSDGEILYVDYNLAKELFINFKIINIHQEIDYYEKINGTTQSYHYHILIKKIK